MVDAILPEDDEDDEDEDLGEHHGPESGGARAAVETMLRQVLAAQERQRVPCSLRGDTCE